jgi:hypothetical protein
MPYYKILKLYNTVSNSSKLIPLASGIVLKNCDLKKNNVFTLGIVNTLTSNVRLLTMENGLIW